MEKQTGLIIALAMYLLCLFFVCFFVPEKPPEWIFWNFSEEQKREWLEKTEQLRKTDLLNKQGGQKNDLSKVQE